MARVSWPSLASLNPHVPQHVGTNGKREFHAHPGHHALISDCGKKCATFRREDVGADDRAGARFSLAGY